MSTQFAVTDMSWTFADRIRKIRKTLGLHQEQFAELLGANRGAYNAWEAGTARPRNREDLAMRIQEITDGAVSAGWVLGLTEDPRGPGATATSTGGSVTELSARRQTVPEEREMDLPPAAVALGRNEAGSDDANPASTYTATDLNCEPAD